MNSECLNDALREGEKYVSLLWDGVRTAEPPGVFTPCSHL